MKNLFLAGIIAILSLVSCGKSDDNAGAVAGNYTIKVLKSDGVTLTTFVAVYDGQTETESLEKALTEDFVKSYQVKQGVIAVSVSADGTNEQSTLTLQLLKDDKVLKTSTAKGKILVANISN